MYSGEPEARARRKTLAVLQDEMHRVLDGARDLSIVFTSHSNNDAEALREASDRLRKAEEDVETLRRMLMRELASVGTLMINREDFLRCAYHIEDIVGYLSGISFRISQIKPQSLQKSKFFGEVRDMVDMGVEAVQRLNEVVRALSINPGTALDLAGSVQKIERLTDDKYRILSADVLRDVSDVREMILLRDIVQGVEDLTDKCLAACDAITVVALGI